MTDSTRPSDAAPPAGQGCADQDESRILKRLAVYSTDATTLPGLEGELPSSVAIDRAGTPDEFGQLLPAARVGVFRIRELSEPDIDCLNAFEERCPLTPILLVLDLSSGNVGRREALRYGIHAVWRNDLRDLPGLVRKALSTSLLKRFFDAFLVLGQPSELIVKVLRIMCVDPSPPTTLGRVAWRAGVYREKLYRQWERHVSKSHPPKGFMDRALLVRIVEAANGRPWSQDLLEELALDLKITIRTVHARLDRYVPTTLPGTQPFQPDILWAFEDWTAPLLSRPSAGWLEGS